MSEQLMNFILTDMKNGNFLYHTHFKTYRFRHIFCIKLIVAETIFKFMSEKLMNFILTDMKNGNFLVVDKFLISDLNLYINFVSIVSE